MAAKPNQKTNCWKPNHYTIYTGKTCFTSAVCQCQMQGRYWMVSLSLIHFNDDNMTIRIAYNTKFVVLTSWSNHWPMLIADWQTSMICNKYRYVMPCHAEAAEIRCATSNAKWLEIIMPEAHPYTSATTMEVILVCFEKASKWYGDYPKHKKYSSALIFASWGTST